MRAHRSRRGCETLPRLSTPRLIALLAILALGALGVIWVVIAASATPLTTPDVRTAAEEQGFTCERLEYPDATVLSGLECTDREHPGTQPVVAFALLADTAVPERVVAELGETYPHAEVGDGGVVAATTPQLVDRFVALIPE